MRTYAERIDLIATCLSRLQIPFTRNELYGGWQLRFPWTCGDVAVHDHTHGAKRGMVETYEFPWDEDYVSELTPEEAADRIIAYWYQLNGEEV